MKKRSLAGNCGIGVFVIAFVTVVVAFCSPNWLTSDPRITNAKLSRLGLWSHCFRSLPDPLDEYQRRFFAGCRWIYDPFTTGYDQIRGYLIPPFLVATQFFFTLAFLAVLIDFILVLIFFLCAGPDHKRFIQFILIVGLILLGAGFSGGLAVIIFASCANRTNWMPGHDNNFLSWSFGLGVVGVAMSFISGTLFLVEATIQKKKRKYLKESQTRFELDQETKA